MRRLLLVLALASITACSSSSSTGEAPAPAPSSSSPPAAEPPAAEPNALAEAVDSLFTTAEAKDAFSGSVIVVDGGKQVLSKGYGFADRTTKRKNAPDTVFRVGSISKQFAASAVLALVSDGKLALTDPVSKFFPDYPKESLTMDGTEVTLHHLLSHTSGLPSPGGTDGYKAAVWRRTITPAEQIDFVKALPLVRKPGSAYAYENYNFLLAAYVVEKTAGKPYETFLQERFFTPLGMKDTGAAMPASDAPRAAIGYAKEGDEFTAMADDRAFKDTDLTFFYGAGQIYSTALDLAKWDRALNGDTILPAAKRDLLFKPNLEDYGYGWVIQQKSGTTFAWHNGAISPLGFTAYMIRVPSKDRFVAFLSNMDDPLIEPFELKVEAIALK